jgi:hypothetical protein
MKVKVVVVVLISSLSLSLSHLSHIHIVHPTKTLDRPSILSENKKVLYSRSEAFLTEVTSSFPSPPVLLALLIDLDYPPPLHYTLPSKNGMPFPPVLLLVLAPVVAPVLDILNLAFLGQTGRPSTSKQLMRSCSHSPSPFIYLFCLSLVCAGYIRSHKPYLIFFLLFSLLPRIFEPNCLLPSRNFNLNKPTPTDTQALETVCAEMQNYSQFEENGFTVYKRYQRREGQKGPLNLKGFGWSGKHRFWATRDSAVQTCCLFGCTCRKTST